MRRSHRVFLFRKLLQQCLIKLIPGVDKFLPLPGRGCWYTILVNLSTGLYIFHQHRYAGNKYLDMFWSDALHLGSPPRHSKIFLLNFNDCVRYWTKHMVSATLADHLSKSCWRVLCTLCTGKQRKICFFCRYFITKRLPCVLCAVLWGDAVGRAGFMSGSACGGGEIIICQIVYIPDDWAPGGSRRLIGFFVVGWDVRGCWYEN